VSRRYDAKLEAELREEGSSRRGVGYIISTAALVLAVALCLICSIQALTKGYVEIFGFSLFRVVTGSMEPTIPTGSILLSREADISEIQVDDIVCFRTNASEIKGAVVTHRVVEIVEEAGQIKLITRGDANIASDAYYVTTDNLLGRVTWYLGKESALTNMIQFLGSDIGFLACIVFPVLLIAGLILSSSIKNMKHDLDLAQYELERGPIEEAERPDPKDVLPGFETLTEKDRKEIEDKILKEIADEIVWDSD